MHAALRTVRVGRGYGITAVAVADFALVANGKSFHVLRDGRPVCGRPGDLTRTVHGVDARVCVLERIPVCVNCTDLLGEVPVPDLVRQPS